MFKAELIKNKITRELEENWLKIKEYYFFIWKVTKFKHKAWRRIVKNYIIGKSW